MTEQHLRLAVGGVPVAEASPPKIRMRHLSKVFGQDGETATVALAEFSLTVSEGEFICVVGPSGCGKTTMLRILGGLERQSAGDLEIAASTTGRPLNSMVFQEHSLFPWLKVIDNVAYGLEMRGIGRKARIERAEPFLKTIGLAKFRNHYPSQLSGGMKQRVSLARAFVNNPEILLMDEPFAALDAQNKLLMQEELLRIWEADRKTVVFITHAIDEALTLADRIVVMSAAPGRIKRSIPVTFPRPRNAVELKADRRFGELYLEIWRIIEGEVRMARDQAGC
jgi:NitT/TauT family transport system ATP-binding protein